jgi:hypothetical protein
MERHQLKEEQQQQQQQQEEPSLIVSEVTEVQYSNVCGTKLTTHINYVCKHQQSRHAKLNAKMAASVGQALHLRFASWQHLRNRHLIERCSGALAPQPAAGLGPLIQEAHAICIKPWHRVQLHQGLQLAIRVSRCGQGFRGRWGFRCDGVSSVE